jgi:hypothetical protein
LGQFGVIKVCTFILEKSKAFANTFTLVLLKAKTASLAVLITFKNSVWKLLLFNGLMFFNVRIPINICGPIQQEPSCREARMRASNYNDIPHFPLINLRDDSLEVPSFQKRV